MVQHLRQFVSVDTKTWFEGKQFLIRIQERIWLTITI